jgi:hypothetical protein
VPVFLTTRGLSFFCLLYGVQFIFGGFFFTKLSGSNAVAMYLSRAPGGMSVAKFNPYRKVRCHEKMPILRRGAPGGGDCLPILRPRSGSPKACRSRSQRRSQQQQRHFPYGLNQLLPRLGFLAVRGGSKSPIANLEKKRACRELLRMFRAMVGQVEPRGSISEIPMEPVFISLMTRATIPI